MVKCSVRQCASSVTGPAACAGVSVSESRLNVSVTRYPDLTGVTSCRQSA